MPLEEGEVVSSNSNSDYSGTEGEKERRREHTRDRKRDEKESSRHRSSSSRHHHHHSHHSHHRHRSSSKSRHDDEDKHRSSHRHREDSSRRSKDERGHSRHHSRRSSEEPSKKTDKPVKSALSIETKVPEVEEGEVPKVVIEDGHKDEKLSPPAAKKIAIDIKEDKFDDDFDMFEKKGPSEEELAAQRRERIRQIKERFKKLEEEKRQQQEKGDVKEEDGKDDGKEASFSSSLNTQTTVQDSHTLVGIPTNSSTLITLEKPAFANEQPKEESAQNKVNKKVQIDLFAIDSDDDDDGDDGNHLGKAPIPSISPSLSVRETADTFNDSEGYYRFRFGDIIGGKYEVIESLGKGVYSTVMLCRPIAPPQNDSNEASNVAIKMSRANDVMRKAGQREADIVRRLQARDPDDKMHIVKLVEAFEFRGHYCSVFEHMHMNLRDVLTKFGKNVGINLSAVRIYAQQILVGLQHIHSCGLIHADIKLDNIVVDKRMVCAKICDFGTAFDYHETEAAPYLASRFYRAPEAILGVPYDGSVDVWAAGCCFAELYTGKVLFPGISNNDMLRLFCELRGPFPKKFLRKGAFTSEHFDENLTYIHLSGQAPKPIVFTTPKDFDTVLCSTGDGFSSADPAESKKYSQFKDVLDKCLTLDPKKRWTASQLLKHPFFSN